jgi:hypothetical protein
VLDHFDRFAAVLHRLRPDPTHDLVAPVDVEEPISLIQPPRANDEPIRRYDSRRIATFSHILILREEQARI